MKKTKALLTLGFALLMLICVPAAFADAINVAWYVYSPYEVRANNIPLLAATNNWNVTFWGPGAANPNYVPTFSQYDVLVTQSWSFPNDYTTGNLTDPDYSGLLDTTNSTAINAARGNRTIITGLDPDFHYLYGRGEDSAGKVLANMVNWAAAGKGLGLVALTDFSGDPAGYQPNGRWWFQPGSPLYAELISVALKYNNYCPPGDNCVAYFSPEHGDPHILLPTGPMAGLTNADLNDWGESFHSLFFGGLPDGYAGYADASPYHGYSVIASPVPEPGTLFLLGSGLAALAARRRKRS